MCQKKKSNLSKICVYVCTKTHPRTYTHTHTRTHTQHIYINTPTNVQTHTHTHTHTHTRTLKRPFPRSNVRLKPKFVCPPGAVPIIISYQVCCMSMFYWLFLLYLRRLYRSLSSNALVCDLNPRRLRLGILERRMAWRASRSESSHHCVGLFAMNSSSLSLFLSPVDLAGVMPSWLQVSSLPLRIVPSWDLLSVPVPSMTLPMSSGVIVTVSQRFRVNSLSFPWGVQTRFRSRHCQRVHLMYPSAEWWVSKWSWQCARRVDKMCLYQCSYYMALNFERELNSV